MEVQRVPEGTPVSPVERSLRAALPPTALAAGPEEALWVDGTRARLVATPTGEEQLSSMIAACDGGRWPVHVRGGGSQEPLGEPIERVEAVLSTGGLTGIVEHAPADLTVTAWAGTRLAELDAVLGEAGQRLPVRAVAGAGATLGGIVATARSGPMRLGHGSVRDVVLGLRACLADGTLVRTGARVVKSVAGYDVTRLLVGSLGTLAVVTQVTMRVLPKPPAEATVWLPGLDPDAAAALWRAVRSAGLGPVAAEWLDAGAAAHAGLPGGSGLALAYEEDEPTVAHQVARTAELSRSASPAGAFAADAVPADLAEGLWHGLHTVPGTATVTLRAGAAPGRLPALLTAAAAACAELSAAPASVSASLGIGVARMWWNDADGPPPGTDVVTRLRSLAEEIGGALVVERAPLALRRTAGAFGRAPAGLAQMRALKRALDPERTLSPGRFVGGI